MRDSRYYASSSCGTNLLNSIDGGSYLLVKGEKVDCGFYLKDLDEMGVQNSITNGVSFSVAFSRKFEDYAVQKLTAGDVINMRGGFNIYESINEVNRSMYGYSEEF